MEEAFLDLFFYFDLFWSARCVGISKWDLFLEGVGFFAHIPVMTGEKLRSCRQQVCGLLMLRRF